MVSGEQVSVALVLIGFMLIGDGVGSIMLDSRHLSEVWMYDIIRCFRMLAGTGLIVLGLAGVKIGL